MQVITSAVLRIDTLLDAFDCPYRSMLVQVEPAQYSADGRRIATGQMEVEYVEGAPIHWLDGAPADFQEIAIGTVVRVWVGAVQQVDPGVTAAYKIILDRPSPNSREVRP
jgi:hypothetical protein